MILMCYIVYMQLKIRKYWTQYLYSSCYLHPVLITLYAS
jgi:hypothetical protein